MRKFYDYELGSFKQKFQIIIVVRNSWDSDKDWDFWSDPDSVNMDPKHSLHVRTYLAIKARTVCLPCWGVQIFLPGDSFPASPAPPGPVTPCQAKKRTHHHREAEMWMLLKRHKNSRYFTILYNAKYKDKGNEKFCSSRSRNFHLAPAHTLQYFKYFVFMGPKYDYDYDYGLW